MARRNADYSSSSDSESEHGGYVTVDANYAYAEAGAYPAYGIEEEHEEVVEIIRETPYMSEERVLSRKALPEELVSTEILSETRVGETEISRTVVARQRVIQNRITQTVEVPVETVIERMDVHPQINTVEFEVEEWKIRDREKVIERVVRVPFPNEIRRPRYVEVDIPFVENHVDRPKVVPVERIITKIIPKYVEQIVEVPVERLVIQEEQVFIEKIREKIIEVPVEKIIEKIVRVPVERVIEKIIEVPVEKVVESVVEVPRERLVERVVEVPVEGKVIERVVEVEVAGRQASTVRRPIVMQESSYALPPCAPCSPTPAYTPAVRSHVSSVVGSRVLPASRVLS